MFNATELLGIFVFNLCFGRGYGCVLGSVLYY